MQLRAGVFDRRARLIANHGTLCMHSSCSEKISTVETPGRRDRLVELGLVIKGLFSVRVRP